MKKSIAIILCIIIALTMTACGSKEKETVDTSVERDLPESNYEETGEGIVYISTAGGTSEDGNVPVIYAEKDTILMQIGLNAFDFNGGSLSYIYVDGILLGKEQLSDTQTSIDLSEQQLTTGTHKIEVVQYDNDDTSSDMITYKSMEYDVKEK